jgi:hypothetical protein
VPAANTPYVRALGVLTALWSVWAAATGGRASATRPADPWQVAAYDREFRTLVPEVAPSGTIGYLEAFEDPGGAPAVAMYYAAQYSLAPRVLERQLVHDFLLVARGTADPRGDPRLNGFVPVASAPGGHVLYRRFP